MLITFENKKGSYRTPYLMNIFCSKPLINRYKEVFILVKKKGDCEIPPSGGAEDDLNEPFVRLLMLVRVVNEGKGELKFEGV
jgi:hypothetical protein